MEIDEQEWRSHRPYLIAVAYRLLGSAAEAEDAVQEAYLRLLRTDTEKVPELRPWLVTVVSRICLDQLRSARSRRESYVGPWLPEPLVGSDNEAIGGRVEGDPADRITLAESVQMALLIVLETLSPAERTVFVLHEVFGMSHDDIAGVVGRSPAACRQLAARARKHVEQRRPRYEVNATAAARVAAAFHAAATDGQAEPMLRLLDPDVVLRTDSGGRVFAARRPVRGALQVARLLAGLAKIYADTTTHAVPVNGGPGFVFERDGVVIAVLALTVADGRVVALDLIVNPAKLRNVRPPMS